MMNFSCRLSDFNVLAVSHVRKRRWRGKKMILAFKVNIQGIYFVVISTQEPHFALENVCMGENNQFIYNVYIEMRRFKIIS